MMFRNAGDIERNSDTRLFSSIGWPHGDQASGRVGCRGDQDRIRRGGRPWSYPAPRKRVAFGLSRAAEQREAIFVPRSERPEGN